MSFDGSELTDILVCPKSRSKLILDGDSLLCTDPDCRLRYAIQEDIPVMLIDEATELSTDEWETIVQKYRSFQDEPGDLPE